MIASNAYGGPASGWIGAMTGMASPARCMVSLIDRRTGRAHRVDGTPLVIHSLHPKQIADRLMQGRDPSKWEVRITALNGEGWA